MCVLTIQLHSYTYARAQYIANVVVFILIQIVHINNNMSLDKCCECSDLFCASTLEAAKHSFNSVLVVAVGTAAAVAAVAAAVTGCAVPSRAVPCRVPIFYNIVVGRYY